MPSANVEGAPLNAECQPIRPHPVPTLQGSRFRRLAETLIARMYHSTAALTIDGTILVAGCDRCYRFEVGWGPRVGHWAWALWLRVQVLTWVQMWIWAS